MSSEAPVARFDAEHMQGMVLNEKYRLENILGTGGVGVVYAAENLWTGRKVALKVLRQDVAAQKDLVRRFLREAQAPTRIGHPNVVDVLDLGEDRETNTLYIVQELLIGSDLRTWLDKRAPLTPRESLDLIVPVLSALVAAHRRGVLHRDIKPENIFLVRGADGKVTPKLIDFGVAKVLDQSPAGRRTTVQGTVFGTPHYMSPEQARGDQILDPRSDLWSVGAVLFEMLTGRTPFEAPTVNLLMVKVITEPAPRVESVRPEVPRDLGDVLAVALAHELTDRYENARAFLSAILETATFHENRSDGVVLPDASWEELEPVSRSVAPATAVLRAGRTRLLRSMTPMILTGVALCAAATSIALAVFSNARAHAPSTPHASVPFVSAAPPARVQCAPAVAAPAPAPTPAAPMAAVVSTLNAPTAATSHAPRPRRAPASYAPAPRSTFGGPSRGALRPSSAYPDE